MVEIEELRVSLYEQPEFKRLMERTPPRRFAPEDSADVAFLEMQLSDLRKRFMTSMHSQTLIGIYQQALAIDAALADRAIGLDP